MGDLRRILPAALLGLATAWVLAAGFAGAQTTAPLPKLSIEPGSVTVSGISSGGYMAHQVHIAYSLTVNGAAIIAGGPYNCAAATDFGEVPARYPLHLWPYLLFNRDAAILYNALCRCMSVRGGAPEVDRIYRRLSLQDTTDDPDQIDPRRPVDTLRGLDGDKVFILAGREDLTVDPAVGKALESLYRKIAADRNLTLEIRTNYELAASHAFPILDAATPNTCNRQCTVGGTHLCDLYYGAPAGTAEGKVVCNYINDCDYDTAHEILTEFYGPLTAGQAVPANLRSFDQAAVVAESLGPVSLAWTSFAETGMIYVPTACRDGHTACRLHISFHGCRQGADPVAAEYPTLTGFNAWAEANRIVVLYPRVVARTDSGLTAAAVSPRSINPRGCWDWWGYTDPSTYAGKAGPQMRTIKCMIDRLSGRACAQP